MTGRLAILNGRDRFQVLVIRHDGEPVAVATFQAGRRGRVIIAVIVVGGLVLSHRDGTVSVAGFKALSLTAALAVVGGLSFLTPALAEAQPIEGPAAEDGIVTATAQPDDQPTETAAAIEPVRLTVTGSATVGTTVTLSSTDTRPLISSGPAITVFWERLSGSGTSRIPGAAGMSYTVAPDDLGARLMACATGLEVAASPSTIVCSGLSPLVTAELSGEQDASPSPSPSAEPMAANPVDQAAAAGTPETLSSDQPPTVSHSMLSVEVAPALDGGVAVSPPLPASDDESPDDVATPTPAGPLGGPSGAPATTFLGQLDPGQSSVSAADPMVAVTAGGRGTTTITVTAKETALRRCPAIPLRFVIVANIRAGSNLLSRNITLKKYASMLPRAGFP